MINEKKIITTIISTRNCIKTVQPLFVYVFGKCFRSGTQSFGWLSKTHERLEVSLIHENRNHKIPRRKFGPQDRREMNVTIRTLKHEKKQ